MIKRLTIFVISLALFCVATAFGQSVSHAQTTTSGGNVQVQTIPGPTITEVVKARAHDSWPWYIVRASGLVAAVCLVILLLSGIGFITGLSYRFLPPLTGWATHRSIGIVFGVSVLLHMFTLLFDHYVPFTIPQLIVPWLSNFKPVTIWGVHMGSLYVALGILAFYASLLVVITSLLWVERKPKTWKLIHLLSYLIIALVFVHALKLGTDTSSGVIRILWVAAGVCIAIAAMLRLRRARTV